MDPQASIVRAAGLVRGVWRSTRWSSPGRFPPLASDVGFPAEAMLVVPASGQSVFRIIGRSTAREWDFLSSRERDRPRLPRQDHVDFLGLSVFGSLEAARANAVRFPKIVAEVRLEAGVGFALARTLADVAEHYSVWGDPVDLLERVVSVTRLDASEVDSP